MIVKMINDGYIVSVGDISSTITNDNVVVIGEAEKNILVDKFNSKPTAPEGYIYKLKADNLEWELIEIPPEPDEPTPEELLNILVGETE